MKANLLNLLLVLSLLTSFSAGQDFDFFYFVQQWPGSYCDSQHATLPPENQQLNSAFKASVPTTMMALIRQIVILTLHLTHFRSCCWRSRKSVKSEYYSGPDTKPSQKLKLMEYARRESNQEWLIVLHQVTDLKSRMQANWPSLSCPSSNDETFWAHEWEKHGTCLESVFNQRDYILAALKLKKQYHILQILQNAANDGSYSLSRISEAIKEATGYTPGVECNSDESGSGQLYQVYLYVDTSGSNLIECPVLPSSHCSSQVQFPSF